jgi:hypothetical protein
MGETSCQKIEKVKKRIDALVGERTSHKEILEFLKEVMIEQYQIRTKVKALPAKIKDEKTKRLMDGISLLDRGDLDTTLAARLFDRLCKVLSRRKEVSEEAGRISRALHDKGPDLIELFKQTATENNEYISALSERLKVKDNLLSFLVGNSIKPICEAYAS